MEWYSTWVDCEMDHRSWRSLTFFLSSRDCAVYTSDDELGRGNVRCCRHPLQVKNITVEMVDLFYANSDESEAERVDVVEKWWNTPQWLS